MSDSSSKKANRYFQSDNKDLQLLFAKIKELDILNQKIAGYLDPNIRKYCQVANFSGNRLTIVVANGSVATQIRFQTNDLLRQFKQDPLLQTIQDIYCKVRPAPISHTAPKVNMPFKKLEDLSPETAEIVWEIAESLEDPKLKEAMQRIAKHVKNKD